MKNLLPLIMKIDEVFCNTFKAMRHELGQDGVRDMRPLWERRLSTATDVFGHPVTVSSLLEQQATKAQKAAKIDIVDLIFE